MVLLKNATDKKAELNIKLFFLSSSAVLKLNYDHTSQANKNANIINTDDDDTDDDNTDDDEYDEHQEEEDENKGEKSGKPSKTFEKENLTAAPKEETFPIYQDFMPETEEAELESKIIKKFQKKLMQNINSQCKQQGKWYFKIKSVIKE